MKNLEIREHARIMNVRFWEIAKHIGCNATTLCIWMREELSDTKRQQIMDAIDKIAEERKRGVIE